MLVRERVVSTASEPRGETGVVNVVVIDETGTLGAMDRWAELVGAVATAEAVVGPAEINVTFVGVESMAELNAEHMGIDGPTDVLSFPIDDDEAPATPAQPRFVGDIVVCPSVASANAPDHAGSVDDELALLLVHGTLHLLGHDHGEPGERDRMWAAERRHLDAEWGALGRDPWGSD